MEDSVKLVVMKRSGEPREFRIAGDTWIGGGESEALDSGRLFLSRGFLDREEGLLERGVLGWSYSCISGKNSCSINGKPLEKGKKQLLADEDVIRIDSGSESLILLYLSRYRETEWTTLALDRGQEQLQICSHMEEENPHRAVLKPSPEGWILEDVNTERGVFVNGSRVTAPQLLRQCDVIRIGDTLFFYWGDSLSYNFQALRTKDLTIHIEEQAVRKLFRKKVLLKHVHLTIEAGNMVLILGGSGAGKTTFINAVTGYEKAKARISQGELDLYEDYDRLKYDIGMVPQQDLLRGEDSAFMTLMNAADMRMPVSCTRQEREARVETVLENFGLSSVKDSLVDKLSGGQRKRLSIGVEFISDPSLFILDEPDSGLDGVMARELMLELRRIADQGKIVMVITHSPDRCIDLFDRVIVLAKDSEQTGGLAFYGGIREAREYFGRDSMEGIVKAVNAVDEGGEGKADYYIERFKVINREDDEYE